jgi:hypothetical protein
MKLKWYDWIPIIGMFTVAYKDMRTPTSEFEIGAYVILQLSSFFMVIVLITH